jgi:hypothetical protein
MPPGFSGARSWSTDHGPGVARTGARESLKRAPEGEPAERAPFAVREVQRDAAALERARDLDRLDREARDGRVTAERLRDVLARGRGVGRDGTERLPLVALVVEGDVDEVGLHLPLLRPARRGEGLCD